MESFIWLLYSLRTLHWETWGMYVDTCLLGRTMCVYYTLIKPAVLETMAWDVRVCVISARCWNSIKHWKFWGQLLCSGLFHYDVIGGKRNLEEYEIVMQVSESKHLLECIVSNFASQSELKEVEWDLLNVNCWLKYFLTTKHYSLLSMRACTYILILSWSHYHHLILRMAKNPLTDIGLRIITDGLLVNPECGLKRLG